MRLSSNLTIKIKLFDILFHNAFSFSALRKLIFWTHRISSLTAAELPPSPRMEGGNMDHKDGAPTGEGGNMDYKDGTTTGGEKIWIIRMAPRIEGRKYGLEDGHRRERSNAKNSNKTGETETGRIETGGQNGVAAWGQGLNRERSKGNKRFQKGRKATKKRCGGCFLLKYR